MFYKVTNDKKDLTKIFETNKTLQVQTRKFFKRLNGFINQCFKKVKIARKSDAKLEELYNQRRYWRSQSDETSKEELEKVDNELAEKYSETMYKKIMSEIKVMSSEDGGYNPGHLWKLKKKLSPRHMEPPTAMRDSEGKLLTSKEDIKAETMKHYKKVFEN